MKTSVIGSGYLGAVHAVVMADEIAILGLVFKPDSDVVVVATDWAEYKALAPSDLADAAGRTLIDGRNLVPGARRAAGCTHRGLGLP